jgi:hypothetical protein
MEARWCNQDCSIEIQLLLFVVDVAQCGGKFCPLLDLVKICFSVNKVGYTWEYWNPATSVTCQ